VFLNVYPWGCLSVVGATADLLVLIVFAGKRVKNALIVSLVKGIVVKTAANASRKISILPRKICLR
jgi:hypothetical protein